MARPDSLQTTLSPSPASASMPACHSARSSSASERGQPVCSTTTTRSSWPARPAAAASQLVGVGHQLEHQAALLQRAEHVVGRAAVRRSAPIGRTPRKRAAAICRSSSSIGLGHRLGRRQAADDGVGVAVGLGPPVELERLVDRVAAGGGGDVHELLDVPARPPRPGRWRTSKRRAMPVTSPMPMLLPPGQVRVPVGAGRVPEVHVGVDDPGRASVIDLAHRRRRSAARRRARPGAPARRALMLPVGRGWLRSPNHPSPDDQLGARRAPAASGLHTQVGDELGGGDRAASAGLDARPRRRRRGRRWPSGGPGELGRGLGPAAAAGGGGVGERDQADRSVRSRAAWSATARAQAASAWMRVDEPSCSARIRSHVARRRPAAGRRARRRPRPRRRTASSAPTAPAKSGADGDRAATRRAPRAPR